jgi:hypothetical protein
LEGLSEGGHQTGLLRQNANKFGPKDLVDLTITITAMNAFNRLGAPFRLPVKAKT